MTAPADCNRCPALVKCRKTVVQGWGNPNARFAFVGQNPGADEDAQGRPFVGRAGRVLATMIRSAEIDVDDIWLTNTVRCLTPQIRKPRKEEWANCRQFLLEELAAVKPSVIIALGEVAAHSLHGRTSLDAVLGQTLMQEELGIPLIIAYHPAFVLRGQWNAVPLILSHFEKAKRIVDGTQRLGSLGEYMTVANLFELRALKDYLLASPLICIDCVTPETPVLRGDLTWVPAGDLRVGDNLIGFDEQAPTRFGTRRFHAAKVLHTGRKVTRLYELRLSSGETLRCTANHQWLVRGGGIGKSHWVTPEEMWKKLYGKTRNGKRPRYQLPRLLKTWVADHSWDEGFLAGAFDADGCLTGNGGKGHRATPSFTQLPGPFLNEVAATAQRLGFAVGLAEYDHSSNLAQPGRKIGNLTINGGFAEQLRFLGQVRPARLLQKWQEQDRLDQHMTQAIEWLDIDDVRPIRTGEVVTLSSSSKTYLAAGFPAHNTETTGKEWKDDELLCISFATESGEGYSVPILQQGGDRYWPETEWAEALGLIGEILASPIPKALQNAAFDIRFLERTPSGHITATTAFGWKVESLQHDTMLMHRLTSEYLPKEAKPNELPHLLSLYSDMPAYEAHVREQSRNKLHMDEVDNDVLWFYAGADADAVARLVPILGRQLDQDGDSRWIYENISIPMIRCCQEMTRRGMLVDQDYFARLCEHYEKKAGELEQRAFGIVGREFNPNSTKQVQDVLFRELALPKSGRKTDASSECEACDKGTCGKHDQVSEAALLGIKEQVDHPILDVLMEIRSVSKLQGTYLAGTGGDSQGFLGHIRKDGRIHFEFKVGGAETGRLSSANPNAQNIPKNVEIEELGTFNAFRRTFVAPPGHVLMEADWSQLEVWVTAYRLAEQFGDRTLLEILESGRDVHVAVARVLWPFDPELDEFEWAREHDKLRTDAKVFTFGINYGLTVEGIMERLHCAKEDAQHYLMSYLDMAPGLRDYKDYIESTILAGEPLINKFGRRRHFPQVAVMRLCNAKYELEDMFREGVNYPIQAGGSDLHSIAHIRTENNEKLRERFAIVDAVHDSCLAEVPAPDLATVLETAWMVKHLWQETALNTVLADGSKLGWQIPVEVRWGRSWGDMPFAITAKGGLLYRGQPVDPASARMLSLS